MNTTTAEIGPGIFKITTYVPEIRLQFSQFLVKDDEPLLYETGQKMLFPAVRDAVARILPPSSIRWISFSHFEADECGSLNEWLALAPKAQAACGFLGAMINAHDFAIRAPRALQPDEVIATGARRFRYLRTPHVPHGWDAGLLFEETEKTLFCSDLFCQRGDTPARTTSDVVGPTRDALAADELGPFAAVTPWTHATAAIFDKLAALEPKRVATMHGSTFEGDGGRAIRDLAKAYREVLGPR